MAGCCSGNSVCDCGEALACLLLPAFSAAVAAVFDSAEMVTGAAAAAAADCCSELARPGQSHQEDTRH